MEDSRSLQILTLRDSRFLTNRRQLFPYGRIAVNRAERVTHDRSREQMFRPSRIFPWSREIRSGGTLMKAGFGVIASLAVLALTVAGRSQSVREPASSDRPIAFQDISV